MRSQSFFSAALLFLSTLFTTASAFPTNATTINSREYSGRVINSNFADPTWIQVGDTYYAFSTTSGGRHTPMATSTDFVNWSIRDGYDALPTVGAWSTGANVWAPDVIQLPNGLFVLYYSAESTSQTPNGKSAHCIGAATSSSVEGPYTPVGDAIQCHLSEGGAIDPAGYFDTPSGNLFVVYKVDGNNIGNGGNCNNGVEPIVSTPLMLQQVDVTNGWSRIGDPVQILDRGDADGPLIEAPSLHSMPDDSAVDGYQYFLFFSSNCYSGPNYDTSYATSKSGVKGPYEKSSAPLLVTGNQDLYSPGGADVGPDGFRILFHSDQDTSADVRVANAGTLAYDLGARTVSIF
ncbi:glycoside hydrolase family 43 protein [Cylindrobasidium torrendii FP15055 ss-10]|uniref:Glycoside hydrolase family 43 protein n=1 Tax=Cylindrobasidium torrendii FP15055 ss-10 TaxID=1314674 RepID=A0A0D7B7D5_9AGAR|nr:glycoside hydrolase family 43 protein [Cylindrobasidium torrendii FP15055 ss-10]